MKYERTDPRIQRTRSLLEDALIDLIHERGFTGLKVQDVTERATLNRGTFYRHYRDVDHLLETTINAHLNELAKTLEQTLSHTAFSEEGIAHYMSTFDHIASHEKFYRVMLTQGGGMPNFTARMLNILVNFAAGGLDLIQPDDAGLTVPRGITAWYQGSAFLGVISWWLTHGLTYSPKYMAALLGELSIWGPYKGDVPVAEAHFKELEFIPQDLHVERKHR